MDDRVRAAHPDTPLTQNVGFGNLITAAVDALAAGQPFIVWHGAINMRATLSLASESARMMMRIIERGARGTFHCCSGASLSRMEAAQAAARAFDLDAGLIRNGPPDWSATAGATVPHDTTMAAAATADRLDYRLPAAEDLLLTCRRERETGTLSSTP